MGTEGHSAKSVQNDCEEGQQGTFEERIRLAVPDFPLNANPRSRPNCLQNGWLSMFNKLPRN
jgi:hypothetical protein